MAVIHWIDDDVGYENWLLKHPHGFVANLHREPHVRYFKIHRVTHKLPDRSNPESANPRTGNNYSKATAENLTDLIKWAKAKIPDINIGDIHFCKTCDPNDTSPLVTEPTADFNEYIRRADQIRSQGKVIKPKGILGPIAVQLTTAQYFRDPKVRAWVMQRADGVCELCKVPAPFINDHDEPFLESHHMILLSEGGPDTPENTCALCPNCHRKMHYDKDRINLRSEMIKLVLHKETMPAQPIDN